MANTYVNKVVQSNGTTLIDISDTTAVASDVAEGKYFYLATGQKVEGSGSGGGNAYTRTVVCPQQTVTPASNGTYYGATLNVSEGFEADAEYIITFNGTEYFFTCQVLWGTNYLLGDINYFYGGSGLPYPFGIIWASGTTCTIARDNGNQVAVKIEKLELTGSPMNLTTKTITQNGTYDAEDDSADGYSSVTVNVPSGASNIVTGTFKGTTTGAAMDVDIAYTGNGYPLNVMIYPKEGAYDANSTIYTLLQRYCTILYVAIKDYISTAPDYNGTGTDDQYTTINRYKNSTTNYTTYEQNVSVNNPIANGSNALATGSGKNVVAFKAKNKMSVYIANTSYGFPANIEFKYQIVYSS